MSYCKYYSQAVEEKMEKRGYNATVQDREGKHFKSPYAAMEYAMYLRSTGYFAQAFAVATRVWDAPSGIVFFKKRDETPQVGG